jgi:flagellar protein FliS
MAKTTYDTYLETEVMSADPLTLVHMLYRGAIEAVELAWKHLAAGSIRERSRQILKAWDILQELNKVLDRERGGNISQRLGQLYGYMQARLLEANTQQMDGPLVHVETLLNTLCEGWRAAKVPGQAPLEEAYTPVSCSY